MTLTVAYERKDFFGNRIFTEDVLKNAEAADVLKAFKALKAGKVDAVKTENESFYYDTLHDRENDVVTICRCETWNSREFFKISYNALVKRFKRA